MQKVKAKIHLWNIRKNAEAFKKVSGTKLCAVVKANAYGHGAEETVNALESIADCFAVALIDEALCIRTAACGKDILVFTPPLDEAEGRALAVNGFIGTIADLRTAKLLVSVCGKYGVQVRVHLKVNTGMNRYGMNLTVLQKTCVFLRKYPCVRVEGLYSHLYGNDRESADRQRRSFLQMREMFQRYYPNAISHLSATFGTLLGKEFCLDMVRIGIGLYGYLPSNLPLDLQKKGQGLALQKGMTVYARSVQKRTLSYGGAGYGKTLTNRERKGMGLVSVYRFGYADGFLRKRENGVCHSEDNVNNLCMDACLRKNGASRGKYTAVLIDAEETAQKTGTISYEVLCAATRRAEFVYDDT